MARGGELLEAPAGGSGDPIHQPPEKWEKFILFLTSLLDIGSGLPQAFLSPYKYGTVGIRYGVLSVSGDATFRRGQHLSNSSLSGRRPSGAFRMTCACGEVEDTVHITTMLLGRKAQLFGEGGIFANQHDWRGESLVTVVCIVRYEGTSSLVPSFLESESRDILRSGDFLFSRDL